MRISWPLTLGVLWSLATLHCQAAYIYPTAKNESLVRTFAYGQAQEIGLFGSSSSSWYRATAAAPKGDWKNVLESSGTTLLCLSNSSSRNGQCATTASQRTSGGEKNIPLQFKEKRTGVVFMLNIRALKSQSFSAAPCILQKPEIIMDIASRGLENDDCANSTRDSASFKVYLPAAEINKLPVGGKWEAQFKANLTTRKGDSFVHNADITINVNDAGRSDIYFPDFGSSAPLVKLTFNKTPSSSGISLSAQQLIDICLYDGFSLYSQGFKLSFSGSDNSAFNLVRVDGTAAATDTINMELQYATTPGAWQEVEPNHAFDVDTSANYLTVNLPGLPIPVICKNTTLQISVPAFEQFKKNAGLYKGVITLSMVLQ